MKKLLYLIFIALMVSIIGCGSDKVDSQKQEPSKILSVQDVASKNNLSIGELNKVYRLDPKYKNSDGSNMVVNFLNVKLENKTVVIDNVLPVDKTREMLSVGFFTVYDEVGKQYSDLSFKATSLENGGSGIVISADKTDLTKCKYLSLGPVNGANGQQILFTIR